MEIGFIHYPVNTLGPGKRIGIWTQGCFRHCKNCMSHSLRVIDHTRNREISSIIEEVKEIMDHNQVDGITISGGEPFMQEDLLDLLIELCDLGFEDIILYTGYKIEELSDEQRDVLAYLSVIIDGEYVDELNDNKPLRGSSNQRVFIVNTKYKDLYNEYLKGPRLFELIPNDNGVGRIIGMYPKGYKP